MSELTFLYKTQSSAKRRTDDLIFSGRSLMNNKKRTDPLAGLQIRPGLDLRLGHLTPLFDSAQKAMKDHEAIHL